MELEIIRMIQTLMNPVLDQIMLFVTMLGEDTWMILLLTLLYWNFNKEAGRQVGFVLAVSITLNNELKELFRFNRPIGEAGIISLRAETATGTAFPSGHTQIATTFYTSIGVWLRNRWLLILGLSFGLVVAFSRVYLGLHYPKDVVAGYLIGIAIVFGLSYLIQKVSNEVMLMLVITVLLAVGFLFCESEDFLKAYGLLLGIVFGSIFEMKVVQFSLTASWKIKLLRWIIGVGLVILIKSGLTYILPEAPVFTLIRYFLFTFFAIGIYPMLFKRLKRETSGN